MNELERETKTDLGTVRIHNEVISAIASLAAMEVKGVIKMGGSLTSNLYELFSKGNLNRGVKVSILSENEIKLEVWIIVEYGVNIPQIALLVQENIKKAVEKMTGLNIIDINVNVQSVQLSSIK